MSRLFLGGDIRKARTSPPLKSSAVFKADAAAFRRCIRCGDALPKHHAGVICPFFCITKVLGAATESTKP